MKRGDKVYVTYRADMFGTPGIYRGKIRARLCDGRWIVRELWTWSTRVVSENRMSEVDQ